MHENPAQVPNSAVFAERRRRLAGYGLAVAGAVLFSSKGIIIKLAYREDVNAETLLALRMALSLPIFAAVGLVAYRQHRRSGTVPLDRRLVVQAALVGMLGYWIASYTDFLGLQHISAQFARLILFTYPGFVVLFGALFFSASIRLMTLPVSCSSRSGASILWPLALRRTSFFRAVS